MKRATWLVSALSLMSLAGCDGYYDTYTIDLGERVFNFNLDTQQSTSSTATLSRSDILGSLDLSDDATIHTVSIESVDYLINAGANNAATQGSFAVQYDELPGPPGPEAFAANFNIPIGQGSEQPLSQLSASAVARFSSNFRSMLLTSSPSSVSVTLLSVGRTPATARLHITGYVKIRGSVTVTDCVELPTIFGVPVAELGECTVTP
jgi:hypothetical protein